LAKKEQAVKKTQKTKATKKGKKVAGGKALAFISSSYNNTIISITDMAGEVVAASSPGIVGFKGSRKSTAYAATKAAEDAASKAMLKGATEVEIFVKGLGVGRNAAVKGIRSGGLKITKLVDKTPIPHGGPTPRKMPRGS
jgi:small subunit ribosomal protein S11